jgi:hypothetical protein
MNFFVVFFTILPDNAGILKLCGDSDSEKAIPFPSTSLLFYFERKLSVPNREFFVEKIHASGDNSFTTSTEIPLILWKPKFF